MKRFIKEFKEFAIKGSVVDLAVGIIVGAAFNRIITSLVNDIIMPPIGLLLKRVDFSNLYINLGSGQYQSLKVAQDVGAPTLNYGLFINALIAFIITAFAVFVVVKQINRLRRSNEENKPIARRCPYCDSEISDKAVRCPHCVSDLK